MEAIRWRARLFVFEMPTRRRLVVLGTIANVPFAGMAWMQGQFVLGLASMGHDVCYIETTSAWPFHPSLLTTTDDPAYPLDYLARVMEQFGLSNHWAFRAAFADGRWYGPRGQEAVAWLRAADAVLNISGSTTPEEVGVPCNLVYIGTDPVIQEFRIANGDEVLRARVGAHSAHFTYGENIGQEGCPVPPLPFPARPTRQPIMLARWDTPTAPRPVFTTVMNWEVSGYDVEYGGETYSWSKHQAFEVVLDLPSRTHARLELALGRSGRTEAVDRVLTEKGWQVEDGYRLSQDVRPYNEYIRDSAGELSVAKDMVVRTRCGWFSERSACYLAAGRPVVTQDTGFSRVLPTGEGLFSFRTTEEAAAALDAIQADYPRHSRAARRIAQEYFRAETVLGALLDALGL